jgi:hypothetical protein
VALFPDGPVPPGDGGAFPERLLALFSQPPRQRFITGDGEEYRLCEVMLRVPDPAAAWAELRGRCLPPPRRGIRGLAGYQAYVDTLPSRWWCESTEDKIDYLGSVETGMITTLGTVEYGRGGRWALTANSEARMGALERLVGEVAPGAGVTGRSVRTADDLVGSGPDDGPDSAAAECRRRGVQLETPPPASVVLEEYFLPLGERQEYLADEITREHAMAKMLAARDEEGLTPAEAVAAGGAARDRVLALLDDCEWRLRREEESGELAGVLPDPRELRRRFGLPPR